MIESNHIPSTDFIMTEIAILEKIKKIVTPYVQRKEGLEDFNDSTDFLVDLKINSANLVDVILDVEDEFNIEIDTTSMDGMLTAGDAKRIILNKMDN
tara:strand:+ start:105194 stop:105484 length:291 start_codon:yes stop_codon:yes gene_type:complete